MSRKKKQKLPRAIDWRLQNSVIADRIGVSPQVVRYWRLKLRKPRAKTHRQHRHQKAQSRREWSTWDWNLRNTDLAELHGLSRERIRQIRNLIGAGKSPKHRQQRTLGDLDRLFPDRFARGDK